MNVTVATAELPPKEHNLAGLPLIERLPVEYADLVSNVDALADLANRAPKEIGDDSAVRLVSDLVKDIAAAGKRAEAARVAEKEPHLQAGREVDGFFKGLSDRITRMKSALEARVTKYLRAKAEAERRQREEEERRQREEAEAKRREAEQAVAAGRTEDAMADLGDAVAAEDAADRSAAASGVKAADLARTRSETGTVATLRETWEFEITDYAAIPIDKLRPYIARVEIEKALRAFVRVGNRELAGVKIFKTESAVVR